MAGQPEEEQVPAIHRRLDWADASMGPKGALEQEAPRFLVVHHTASGNDYPEDSVAAYLRRVFDLHTGKGWPDVAYNFFVDRYGGCWEGRTGSLAGPVRADATGGSQGHAQLVCLIGNFEEARPTAAAVDALVELLAWLAERDGIDAAPGAMVEFVSRGSNRWPAGETVRTRTIAGHREMSQTLCPGGNLFALLEHDIPTRVAAARRARTGSRLRRWWGARRAR